MKRDIFRSILLLLLVPASCFSGGPPYFTDDPVPVEYHHWEVYLANAQERAREETDATLPHLEVNYGASPHLQLHVIAPMGYLHTDMGTFYGFGNVELGAKYRFIEESDSTLHVGTFIMLEVPTGSREKQLSNGRPQIFFPLWLQKDLGKLTLCGGGGYWYNPGDNMRNWVFTGLQAQYDISDIVSLGGEVYFQSASSVDEEGRAAVNLGGIINASDANHFLFSVGRTIAGEMATTIYLGYQLTM